MPVHIKGGGGAGFPQGWKGAFNGIVHESAIAKGDPVVTGVYSDITNGMDVIALPSLLTYFNTFIALSEDGKMFVIGANNGGTAATSKKLYKWNEETLAYEAITIPTGTTAFAMILNGGFSPDGKYLATAVSTSTSASGNMYFKLYKIVGATITFLYELALGVTTSLANVDFFDYLQDATQYRIIVTAGGSGRLIRFNNLTDTVTSYVSVPTGGIGITKIDETSYVILQGNSDTGNRRYLFDVVTDTVLATYNGYIYTQSMGKYALAISDDGQYAVIKTSASPYINLVKNNGSFTWSLLANPDVLPSGVVNGADFSPGETYLAVALNVSPYLIIYKRTGDILTKIANPTTMPTKPCFGVKFSKDGKFLFVCQGDVTQVAGVFGYGLESGNIVSKITSFSANPLSWFPAGRKKIGVAIDSGNPGDEVRVNLFPKLNDMPH